MSPRFVCMYRALLTFPIIAFALGPELRLDENLYALGSDGPLNADPLPLDQLSFSPSSLALTGSLFNTDLGNSHASGVDAITLDSSEPLYTDFTLPRADQTVSSLYSVTDPLTLPNDTEFYPSDGSENLFTTDENGEIADDSFFLAGCLSSPIGKSRRRMRRADPAVCPNLARPRRERENLAKENVVPDGTTLSELQDLLEQDRKLNARFKVALGGTDQNVLCDIYTEGLFPWGICSAAIGLPNELLPLRDLWFFTMNYDPARVGTLR